MDDWALKTNYLPIYLCLFNCSFLYCVHFSGFDFWFDRVLFGGSFFFGCCFFVSMFLPSRVWMICLHSWMRVWNMPLLFLLFFLLLCFYCKITSSRISCPTQLFFFSCELWFRVSLPRSVRPTLLRHNDMGSLTCAYMWVHAVHTNGDQAQRSLHQSWLRGVETLSHLDPRGDRT